ncbi:MAG: hypothetical protein DRP66_10290 [Planctomycetota bacterium]|nr:MAG: hypothetical protein DRP66_10290 [Planctomycetota bacterium]
MFLSDRVLGGGWGLAEVFCRPICLIYCVANWYNAFLKEGEVVRKPFIILLAVCALLPASAAIAGGFNKNIVSGDANWVAHVDVEGFNNSAIGRIIRRHLDETGKLQKLEAFKAVFSFHPLDDIRGVTIYGRGKEKENAVAVIQAKFDKETLLKLLGQNATHKEIKYGKYQIQSWIDDKHKGNEDERQYGSFHGADTVVMGTGLDAVRKSLDVLDGEAKNARQKKVFRLLRKAPRGAVVVAAANGLGKMAEQWDRAVMLKNTNQSCLLIGETEGAFYIDLKLDATSSETAAELTQMIQGVIALLNLTGRDQPKVAELAAAIKLTTKKKLVHMHFEKDVEEMGAILRAEWEKQQAQKSEKSKACTKPQKKDK